MKRFVFLIVAVLLASCAADATEEINEANRIVHVPAPESPIYHDVVDMIEKNPKTGKPTQTLEELIPALPEELRSNFTFIYESRSPRGGLGDPLKSSVSTLYPRVILYSKDGRVVLAFTGNPKKPGYDIVEIIRFINAETRFEISEYVLPAAQKKDRAMASLAHENGSPNPPACLRCHGQDPRPIYDSYPLWPGFFGSIKDTFPKNSPELKWYQAFLAKQKDAPTGIYRQLNWPKDSPVSPYLPPESFTPDPKVVVPKTLYSTPNTRLGMAWAELNRQRIMRKVKAAPHYKDYRYGIVAGLLGCQSLPMTANDMKKIWAQLHRGGSDRKKRLVKPLDGVAFGGTDMVETYYAQHIADIIYASQALGIGHFDWSMGFERNSFAFYDGIVSGEYSSKIPAAKAVANVFFKEDLILEMLEGISDDDSDLRPYFKTYQAFHDTGYPFGTRLDIGYARRLRDAASDRKTTKIGKASSPLHPESETRVRQFAQCRGNASTFGPFGSPLSTLHRMPRGFGGPLNGTQNPFQYAQ